jgi:predicted dehydrogenase
MELDATEPDASSPGSVMRPLRLGVLGCELGRTRYGGALAALPSIQIAGLYDSADSVARVWARELGGRTPVYADASHLLEQPLDAVLIAAPIRERADRIAEALRAGKPALAEVPFALSLSDFDDLIALSVQHGVLLMPALPRRLDPYVQTTSHELDAGAIGTLQQVRCAWSFPIENVKIESVQSSEDVVGGGWNMVLQALACQTVDLCRLWQGAGATVTADVDLAGIANVSRSNGRRPQESALANIIVTHVRGQSTHQITRGRSIQPDERYILTGDEGNMELVISAGATAATSSAPNLRRQRAGERSETIAPAVPNVAAEVAGTELAAPLPVRNRRKPLSLSPAVERIRLLLAHFAGCVLASGTPLVSAADARAVLEIVQAAYVSSAERTKVTLPLRRSPDIAGLLHAFSTAPRALPPAF